MILPRVSSTSSTCTKYGFINSRVLISSTKSVSSYLHNIFLSLNVFKFSFMKPSSVATEIYHQWSGRDEVAAAEMLVMVVSYRFHQRYTAGYSSSNARRRRMNAWDDSRWTEVTSCLDNDLWKLERVDVCSSRRSQALSLRTMRPWPSLDWHWQQYMNACLVLWGHAALTALVLCCTISLLSILCFASKPV